jgi:hypothetical protein
VRAVFKASSVMGSVPTGAVNSGRAPEIVGLAQVVVYRRDGIEVRELGFWPVADKNWGESRDYL